MAHALSLPYHPQKADGYCLPACAQMVLAYLGSTRSQEDLARQLGVMGALGVPASRLKRLQSDTLDVFYAVDGEWPDVLQWLAQDTPVIVAVDTGELPYWRREPTAHVVVVVGADDDEVYLVDPSIEQTPLRVSQGDFLLAWQAMDGRYGVILRR